MIDQGGRPFDVGGADDVFDLGGADDAEVDVAEGGRKVRVHFKISK